MAKRSGEKDSRALNFQVRESYKKARTNIVYSIIKEGCKKILFTSASKGEGKTTTAVNVGVALAQQVNTRVIIVDCDLRRPRIHSILGESNEKGLVQYFNNECSYDDIVKKSKAENFDFISCGVIPPNPSELLSCDKMKQLIERLEQNYDYVIFDTPPVNMVVDCIPIVKLSDGIVLVAKHNISTKPELDKAVGTLRRNGGKTLGIILNGIPFLETSKGGYYKNSAY